MGPDYTEKMQGYVEALEEEKSKILVFQRELPLCLELVTQAIEACKHQLSGTSTAEYNVNGQSECSEQTSTEGTPVLEEFMPLKRTSRSSDDGEDDEEEQERHSHKQLKVSGSKDKVVCDSKKKSDWLRSAQLWNQTPDPPPKELLQDYHPPKKVSVVEVKRNGGAFQPFHREKTVEKSSEPSDKPQSPVPTAATSSTAEPATASGNSSGSGKRGDKEGQAQRKQRRCWSPELHRRFLQALQQLGGSHAATPKQIRELMKVDGLTNDEVKSHLQKFRLHTRRPSPTIHSSNTSQAPQIVVVGGIWVPPPEYAGAAATESARPTTANGIYAPIATAVQPASFLEPCLVEKSQHHENWKSEGRSSHSTGGGVQSHSPSTSSSSRTTTSSPVY